jgi:hypothetical protein
VPSLRALFVGRGWRDTLVLIGGGIIAASAISHAAQRGTGWAKAIAVAAMVVAYLFIPWLKPLRARNEAARLERLHGKVTVDDWGVTRICGKVREAVAWHDVVWVAIETTDEGPGAEDFFYLLAGADGKGVVVPNFLAIELNLVDAMYERLPGLDYKQAAIAIGSTTNAIFKIWERPEPPAGKPPRLSN